MKTKPDQQDVAFAANLTITPEILQRVAGGNLSLSSPCVICGESFSTCVHTVFQTEAVIKRIRKMPAKVKKEILNR